MEDKEELLTQLSCHVHDWLLNQGYALGTAQKINLLINILVVGVFIYVIDLILRTFVVKFFYSFTNKSKTTFDDYLVKSNFPKFVAHIIPFILIKRLIPYVFVDFPTLETFLLKATDIYLILLIVFILRSIVRSIKNYLRTTDRFYDKPLDSYAQVVIIFIWFIGIVFIFSELTGYSIVKFITALGAASAILLLVFRDTILGFVASIQTSTNDMVRIGDWITMEKYGADGDVVEINLATVKVRNFDNTITTIPTYALISDSFKNWRGMQESGGRRIKRAIFIKASSVKFLSQEELKKFQSIQAVQQYIEHRQRDINKFNTEQGYDKDLNIVNGRNQTNLGVFRKYCDLYLQNHSATNKDLMIMTRHMAPTPEGIPLEIYVFSSDKRWENYERIMADIFEHIIAAVPHFDLEIFESPSGSDLQNFMKNRQSN
ncbi:MULTISPECIES: mechanosensitive ion channel family protein [Galbibacter]|uniref:Mechanosensitive ion channel n=1 Tax=Galbibacter pacificus TaxID=2996052 RepID=A0ABT6FQM6_9FLAO|nr:mechanosensitive ion channel domain-containing protein [Galbibacter pacificus]MDG3581954.1 mechanosensitive ion channel [Galbibacter pacificus]MDG3585572.1 mechanosensitive ion channel [Galbibacter pacificus]